MVASLSTSRSSSSSSFMLPLVAMMVMTVMLMVEKAGGTVVEPSTGYSFDAFSTLGATFNITAPVYVLLTGEMTEADAELARNKIVATKSIPLGKLKGIFDLRKRYNFTGIIYDDSWSLCAGQSSYGIRKSLGLDMDLTFPYLTTLPKNTLYLANRFEEIQAANNNASHTNELIINMISDQLAYHDRIYQSGLFIFSKIIMLLMNALCFIAICRRLPSWIRYTRKKGFNVTIAILAISLASTIIRLVTYSGDLFFFEGNFSWFSSQFLLTFTIPMNLACSLLISLFWHEILSPDQCTVKNFIQESRKFFIIGITIAFVLELIVAVLRGLMIGPYAIITPANYAIVAVLTVPVTLFYYRSAKALLGRLTSTAPSASSVVVRDGSFSGNVKARTESKATRALENEKTKTATNHVRHMAIKIHIVCLAMILVVISGVFLIAKGPNFAFVSLFFGNFGLQLWTLFQVLMHARHTG